MTKITRVTAVMAAAIATTAVLSSRVSAQEVPEQPDQVQVGDEAPLFKLRPLDGKRVSLAELRGVKPVVLIFFRGTW